MLPPAFEPIIAQLTALYRKFLVQDDEAVAVPELLSAEGVKQTRWCVGGTGVAMAPGVEIPCALFLVPC
jgi:hypothetical protein